MITRSAPPANPDDDGIAVRVEHVSKDFTLWSSHGARLREPLLTLAASLTRPFAKALSGRLGAKARALSKEFHALNDISLEIRKGESWGFIGVNGSGKSTLLKIISGHFRPSSGRVEVDGKVSILDYTSGLHGEFTGRENVYLKGAILGLSRKELDERFQDIADFADIGDFIDQPVKTYSSGMQARLGFAIIAHVEADILITDEALAVGDAFFVQKCMAHIRRFIKNGTFLFVSHAISDVLALCDKAVWLEKGRIMAIGPARDVAEAYMARQVIAQSQDYEGQQQDTELSDRSLSVARETSEIMLRQPELARKMDHAVPRITHDPRAEYLNHSKWRNDIEIPDFARQDAGYGVGGATIEAVGLSDENGLDRSWIVGGEVVRLTLRLKADKLLSSPIVGFQILDRLGQTLIADNTYLIGLDKPFSVAAGGGFTAEFCFQMPLLPVGDYVVRAAVASGSESSNAMLQVLDSALVFRSVTSGARHGLVGVPMQHIRITAV